MTEATTNGYDPKLLKDIISRVEEKDAEMESSKARHMKFCRDARESIQGIITEAEARGLPKKELKAILKARAAQRKLDAVRDGLEPDEQDTFDMLADVLGDFGGTALGEAALNKAKKTETKRAENSSAVDTFGSDDEDVRSTAQKETEKYRQEREAREAAGGDAPAEQEQTEGLKHLEGIKPVGTAEAAGKPRARRGNLRAVQ